MKKCLHPPNLTMTNDRIETASNSLEVRLFLRLKLKITRLMIMLKNAVAEYER